MDRRWAWTVSGRFGISNARLTPSCVLLIFLYKNSPLVLFLSQMNPVQALILYLRFVLTFSHLHIGPPSGLLHVCPPEFFMHCSSLSYVQHAPPSSFSLIWHLTDGIWQEIQIVKVLCMQFFSCLVLLTSSWFHISSSAPCSRTPSSCFLSLIRETNFHIHVKPPDKLIL